MIAASGRQDPGQRRDFARVVHADLEDAELGVAGQAGEAERQAPMIVEVALGRGGPAECAQRQRQHLLRARLADAAGHADDLRLRARPRGAREIRHAGLRVADDEKRRFLGRLLPVLCDHRGGGPFGERVADEAVPVAILAANGDEQVARLDVPAVDRNAVRGPGADGAARGRGGGIRMGPEDSGHAALPAKARATWRSLKGRILSPTICPSS